MIYRIYGKGKWRSPGTSPDFAAGWTGKKMTMVSFSHRVDASTMCYPIRHVDRKANGRMGWIQRLDAANSGNGENRAMGVGGVMKQ